METGNLEAFKAGKIRPTMAGLSDSKYTAKDCTVMLGITNPHSFELPEYLKYNILKLKGNVRFLEVTLNREGESNGVIALYFDGAVNYFNEMPPPTDSVMLAKVYHLIESINTGKVFFSFSFKKLISKILK